MVNFDKVNVSRRCNGNYLVEVMCPRCNQFAPVADEWTDEQLKLFGRYLLKAGYISDMTFLTTAQKEQCTSGICPYCLQELKKE